MIVFSDFLIDFFCLLWINLLYKLGRNACVNATGLYNCFTEDYGTGSDDCTLTNDGMVQYDRTHTDESPVALFGPMDCHVVTDGNVVSNLDGRLLI